jgi:hypothetical protein
MAKETSCSSGKNNKTKQNSKDVQFLNNLWIFVYLVKFHDYCMAFQTMLAYIGYLFSWHIHFPTNISEATGVDKFSSSLIYWKKKEFQILTQYKYLSVAWLHHLTKFCSNSSHLISPWLMDPVNSNPGLKHSLTFSPHPGITLNYKFKYFLFLLKPTQFPFLLSRSSSIIIYVLGKQR